MENLSKLEISTEAYGTLQNVIRSLYDSKDILDRKLDNLNCQGMPPEDAIFLNQIRLRLIELIDAFKAI